VAILSYMPLRLQNLTALAFGIHLFMREEARAISTMSLSAGEVKNRSELAFDIPPHVAKMLIEYRDRIAPKVIGHRPERLFVNVDGTPKCQETVAWLITRCLESGPVSCSHHTSFAISARKSCSMLSPAASKPSGNCWATEA